jgi:hypothetical protein
MKARLFVIRCEHAVKDATIHIAATTEGQVDLALLGLGATIHIAATTEGQVDLALLGLGSYQLTLDEVEEVIRALESATKDAHKFIKMV